MAHREYPTQLRIKIHGDVLEFDLTTAEPMALVVMDSYIAWVGDLADKAASARIDKDVGKMRRGLFGDWKETDGIFEMRLDYGPGYRVYYARFRDVVIILLGGGDKGTQKRDVARARRVWQELKDEIEEV